MSLGKQVNQNLNELTELLWYNYITINGKILIMFSYGLTTLNTHKIVHLSNLAQRTFSHQ